MRRGGSGRGRGPSQGGLSFPHSSSYCQLPWQSPLYPQPPLSLDMIRPLEPSPPRPWLFQEAFQVCLSLVSVVRANKGVP